MSQKQANTKTKIVVTTGGTGGHVFPAEAIAGALIQQGAEVTFVTDRRGQEFRGLKQVPVYRLMAESVTGRSVFGKVDALIKLYLGCVQALFLLIRIKPDAVVGVGGYASFPAVMAAHMLRIPVVLHEQNAVLGRANRILARGVRFIGTSFSPTKRVPDQIPQIQVGLPVRPILTDYRRVPYPKTDKSLRLFVFGGSQGARFFSRRLPEALLKLPTDLREKMTLIQQVRPEDMEIAHSFYDRSGFRKVELKPFFTDMPEQLAKAHLVIGRGGAGTVTEVMAVGRPAVIIPLPSAADNHQEENAKLFCQAGGGWLWREADFDPDRWAKDLTALLRDKKRLTEAACLSADAFPEQAAEKMAKAVTDMIKGLKK